MFDSFTFHLFLHTHIYIYIYVDRLFLSHSHSHTHTHTHTHIYIYIYIYIYQNKNCAMFETGIEQNLFLPRCTYICILRLFKMSWNERKWSRLEEWSVIIFMRLINLNYQKFTEKWVKCKDITILVQERNKCSKHVFSTWSLSLKLSTERKHWLFSEMWGSTGVHRLWARPCFSSSVLRVWFVWLV